MYDSKTESEKNYLYTSRVIALFFFIFAVIFITISKNNATTYIAIKISPQEVNAIYDKSIKVHNYKIKTYFKYVDKNGNSHTYYEFGKKIRNEKKIKILYSKYFPNISYPINELDNLKPDFYIFTLACLFLVIFLLMFAYFGVRIYMFKN